MIDFLCDFTRFQDGQTKNSRETAHERLHGLGSGGQAAVGRSIPESAQRRTQQDSWIIVEVRELEYGRKLHFLLIRISTTSSNVYGLTRENEPGMQ